MGRKSFYLGCFQVGYYEVGRDPRFFDTLKGFAWKDFVCTLDKDFVEKVLQLQMKPGELRRIKLGSLKTTALTEDERKEIEAWKTQTSRRVSRALEKLRADLSA